MTKDTDSPMLAERSWQAFSDAQLFWWVNRSLHLFGWALVKETNNGEIVRVYPARCRYRGFDAATEARGYEGLTQHLSDNIDTLLLEVEDSDD
ncbi:MAG: hypothetical protein AAFV53_37205 [Myxococcota bacterium]